MTRRISEWTITEDGATILDAGGLPIAAVAPAFSERNSLIVKAWLIPELEHTIAGLVKHIIDYQKGKIWSINYKEIREAITEAQQLLVKLSEKGERRV